MASAAETAAAIERREARTRWLLLAPTVVVLTLAAVGPLFIMLAYSFLEKNPYGGVQPGFSLDGWTAVFLERDIFDNTLSFADAHVSILLADHQAVLLDHGPLPDLRLSDRLFHRHAQREVARCLALPHHHSVLDQPADPHLRDPGTDPQRGRGQFAPDVDRHHRPAAADHVHGFRNHAGHGLCLSAADGAAALCQPREARFPAGGGRLRSVCQSPEGAVADHPAAGAGPASLPVRSLSSFPRSAPMSRRACWAAART